MPSNQERKVAAKRFNERIKLTATLANNLSVGTLIGGLVGPIMGGRPESFWAAVVLFVAAIILHFYGRSLLSDLKSEE